VCDKCRALLRGHSVRGKGTSENLFVCTYVGLGKSMFVCAYANLGALRISVCVCQPGHCESWLSSVCACVLRLVCVCVRVHVVGALADRVPLPQCLFISYHLTYWLLKSCFYFPISLATLISIGARTKSPSLPPSVKFTPWSFSTVDEVRISSRVNLLQVLLMSLAGRGETC